MAEKYRWFVEPLDSHTNEIIAKEVGEENLMKDAPCANNKKNLWQCDYSIVAYLMRSCQKLQAKFRIFVQEGNGTIREWNLANKEQKKWNKKIADMKSKRRKH